MEMLKLERTKINSSVENARIFVKESSEKLSLAEQAKKRAETTLDSAAKKLSVCACISQL